MSTRWSLILKMEARIKTLKTLLQEKGITQYGAYFAFAKAYENGDDLSTAPLPDHCLTREKFDLDFKTFQGIITSYENRINVNKTLIDDCKCKLECPIHGKLFERKIKDYSEQNTSIYRVMGNVYASMFSLHEKSIVEPTQFYAEIAPKLNELMELLKERSSLSMPGDAMAVSV